MAACMVKGTPEAADCLVRRLEEKSQKIEFLDGPGECDDTFYASSDWLSPLWKGGTIHICTVGWMGLRYRRWAAAVQLWEGVDGSIVACALLDYACTLLHELGHICDFLGPTLADHDENECDKIYRLENIFRWALFQRYSFATNNDWCARFRERRNTLCAVSSRYMLHSCLGFRAWEADFCRVVAAISERDGLSYTDFVTMLPMCQSWVTEAQWDCFALALSELEFGVPWAVFQQEYTGGCADEINQQDYAALAALV
jgi:hypothetical protein